jgi:hypothetical protein
LANLVALQSIAILGSASFLVIFAVVNAACFKLARETKANRIICATGALACTVALVMLLYHTYEDNPHALWVFLSMIGVALLFEMIYPRFRRRTFRLPTPVGR